MMRMVEELMMGAVAGAFLFLDAAADGGAQPTVASPPMSETADPLHYFVGTWSVVARDPDSGERLTVCYRVRPFMGDKWLSGTAKSDQPGLDAADVWGRDPSSGELMRSIYNVGGTYGTVRSGGWKGDSLVFEGEARSAGGAVSVRETIKRLGPDEFEAIWAIRRGTTWHPYSIESAKRRSTDEC